ncbi:hypothetical protein [Actinomycetospora termitidis]|uniref:ACT domain-containing protein n=1 Tax=Actinomycetospora termitidis TaxID=3053470 RepID=A0ABT7MIW0_9PSEU|nr:hypothetical protein [Actinomycetospora sp. Odt1-22]MDL5160612.1 hypothetical protein [Actinomycetospora sp. Odt1-22]
MTTLEPAPIPASDVERAVNGPGRRPSRLPRPFTVVTTGGMPGVMTLASTLCERGYRVPDFQVDVHEGVSCSSIACTVALTVDECSAFAASVRDLPGVLSVEPY